MAENYIGTSWLMEPRLLQIKAHAGVPTCSGSVCYTSIVADDVFMLRLWVPSFVCNIELNICSILICRCFRSGFGLTKTLQPNSIQWFFDLERNHEWGIPLLRQHPNKLLYMMCISMTYPNHISNHSTVLALKHIP